MLGGMTAAQNEALMETMRETVDAQHDPKVGMFWFNAQRDILVGVHSVYASELPFNDKGRKTVQVLHHTAWPGVRKAAIAIGSPDGIWNEEDYTQVPRGRVFEIEVPNGRQFDILVGSWLEEHPRTAELIVEEFNLRGVPFQFIYSEHWDIGRGTSEIFV